MRTAPRWRLGGILLSALAISACMLFVGPATPSNAVVGGTPVTSLSNLPFIGYFAAAKYPSWDFLHKTTPARENCSATLISPDYALTAAHCVTDGDMKAGDITLVFGRARMSDSGGTKSGVSQVILPPGSSPHADLYDLAVLKLSKPITDYALPLMGSACPDWTTRSPMFAIGWGQSGKYQDDHQPPDDQAQQASLLFDGTSPALYPDRYFWAVDPSDVMQYGDSGSGLFFQRPDGSYEMLGVLHEFQNAGADWDSTPTRQSVFERTDVGSGNWAFLQNYVLGYVPCLPTAPVGTTPATATSPTPTTGTAPASPALTYSVAAQSVTGSSGATADLAHARPGQPFTVTIAVRNTGNSTWSSAGPTPVRLGTAQPQDHVGVLRAPGWLSSTRAAALEQSSVAPGQTGSFRFPILAPSTAGTVTEHFNLVADGLGWFDGPGISVTVTTVPVVGMAIVPHTSAAQWIAAADGGVFAYAGAPYYGSMGGQHLNAPVVGIAATPSGDGYWLTAADGGVFAYGDAAFLGSLAGQNLNGRITSIAATADGHGYWLVGSDGGVYAFGTARFGGSLGSAGSPRPVVAIARTAAGYAIADSGGEVTAFTTPGSPAPRNTLYPGQQLNPGDQLTSPNGRYSLVMQADGNLVEYDAGQAVWASGTHDPGSVLQAQADGNLVIYGPGHVALWATGTNQPGSVLVIQDDRNIVLYAPGQVSVWATGTTEPAV